MKFRRAPGGAGLPYKSLDKQAETLTPFDWLSWSLDDRLLVNVVSSMTFTREGDRMMEVKISGQGRLGRRQ